MPLHVDVVERNRWWIIANGDIEKGATRYIMYTHNHVGTVLPDVLWSSVCAATRPRGRQIGWDVVPPPRKSMFKDRGCLAKGNGGLSCFFGQ